VAALKNKRVLIIFAVLPCVLHAAMLQTPFNFYVYTSALKVFLFILSPMIFFAVFKGGKFTGVLPRKGENLRLSFVTGACVFAVILGAFAVVRPNLDEAEIIGALEGNGITAGNFLPVFIYVVLINAALEEIFFRGFVFQTLFCIPDALQ
jgi:membrane protease YdiL (CAAX protease family)